MLPRPLIHGLVLCAVASPAFAGGGGFETTVWADVEVDAGGHVSAATLPDEKMAKSRLGAFVLDRISHWEFEPARHNGVAVVAQTSLEIRLALAEHGSDYDVSVLGASPSPRPIKMSTPQFPGSALLGHKQGRVVVDFFVEPDGSVSGATAHGTNAALEKASIDAVLVWRFKPEIVDGIAARTHASVPIAYVIGTERPKLPPVSERSVDEHLTADAAVKLKTDVTRATL